MSSNTPINRNRVITVWDTDAERPVTAASFPMGQFGWSRDTNELRIADGTPVWPAPIGGSGSVPPFSHTLYVDGGTATPPVDADGSVAKPYKTIMAAVAAMIAGTAIYVMPGTYDENIVWRDLENTALIGISASSVMISPTAGDAFTWIPAAAAVIQFFSIENVTFAPKAGRSVVLDGGSTDSFFINGTGRINGCLFTNVAATLDIFLQRINSVVISNCINFSGGDVEARNVSSGIFLSAVAPASKLTASWDESKPKPANGRQNISLAGMSVFADVVMDKSPFVLALSGTLIISSITDTGLVFDALSGNGPSLLFFGALGVFGGSAGVTLAYPEAPPGSLLLQFAQADLSGPINLTVAGPTRLPVGMRGVVFRQTNPFDVNLGDFLDVDALGSSYEKQSIFQVSGGGDTASLDRDTWNIYGVPDFAVATPIPISPPFPVGAQYAVAVNPSNPVAVAVPPAGKNSNQFTATPSAATGDTDFGIIRSQS